MLKKAAAFYSIFIGISVVGMWSMIILSGGITEGPIQISFHLFSEFLMAILLLIGGMGLLKNHAHGKKLFLLSHGMLVYSVLNAAGYYGQRADFTMTGMFIGFFVISSVLLVLSIVKQDLIEDNSEGDNK